MEDSRVEPTKTLAKAIAEAEHPPRAWVLVTGVGIYPRCFPSLKARGVSSVVLGASTGTVRNECSFGSEQPILLAYHGDKMGVFMPAQDPSYVKCLLVSPKQTPGRNLLQAVTAAEFSRKGMAHPLELVGLATCSSYLLDV